MPPCQVATISVRIRGEIGGVVEEHIAEPAAHDDAEHGDEHQRIELHARERSLTAQDAPRAEPPSRGKAGEIHEPVPAHRERPDGERHRIDVGVRQHAAQWR
jgi:hypothetical protein